MSSKGGPALRLGKTDAAHAPVLSRGWKTIIYLVGTGGASTRRVMAADGKGDRALFRKPPGGCANVGHMAWSRADTQLLALVCDRADGFTRIVLARIDGTSVRTLPTGSTHADDPTFSPDGLHIAYWADKTVLSTRGTLFMIATSGRGAPHPLKAGAPVAPTPTRCGLPLMTGWPSAAA